MRQIQVNIDFALLVFFLNFSSLLCLTISSVFLLLLFLKRHQQTADQGLINSEENLSLTFEFLETLYMREKVFS